MISTGLAPWPGLGINLLLQHNGQKVPPSTWHGCNDMARKTKQLSHEAKVVRGNVELASPNVLRDRRFVVEARELFELARGDLTPLSRSLLRDIWTQVSGPSIHIGAFGETCLRNVVSRCRSVR